MNSLKKKNMTILEKNVLHRKSEIEEKNDMIFESENKLTLIKKKKKKKTFYFPPVPSRRYCADKILIIVIIKKNSFKNFNTCTDPGIKTSIYIPNLRRKNRSAGLGK